MKPSLPGALLLCATVFYSAPLATGQAAVLVEESFDYPDGPVISVSDGRWVRHSGTAGQADVVSGALQLAQSESEDVHLPFETDTPEIVYVAFDVEFSELPSGNGAYFAHFKDGGNGFRGRLFATATGAADGFFRVGVASTGASPDVVFERDLAVETTYRLVIQFNAAVSQARLWVDPATETDTFVETGAGSSFSMESFAFRQSLSSGNGMGTLTVDNLVIGDGFPIGSSGSEPEQEQEQEQEQENEQEPEPEPEPEVPVIEQGPASAAVPLGSAFRFEVRASGIEPLQFAWFHNGTLIVGANGAVLEFAEVRAEDAGTYHVKVSNTNGVVTSAAAELTVEPPVNGPAFTRHPEAIDVPYGESVVLTVEVSGTPPIELQWWHDGQRISGATGPELVLESVRIEDAGEYMVTAANAVGSVLSDVAVLAVRLPEPPSLQTIAELRALVDPDSLLPADSESLHRVRGIVTTEVNLADGKDALFFIQDESAGIAVYWKRGTNPPPSGAEVEVAGSLGHSRGLLQLDVLRDDPRQWVTLVERGAVARPEPRDIDPAWWDDPVELDAREGLLVRALDAEFDRAEPAFPAEGGEVDATLPSGEAITIGIDARTDLAGQPKPTGPVTIIGVLAQRDTSDPRSSGYFLMPTRYADLVSEARPPLLHFEVRTVQAKRPGDFSSHAIPEMALCAGDVSEIEIAAEDADGADVKLSFKVTNGGAAAEPENGLEGSKGLPEFVHWEPDAAVENRGRLILSPKAEDRGRFFELQIEADNGGATNTVSLQIHVLSSPAEAIVLTEFLANPASSPDAPHFNPLSRSEPSSNPSNDDEFVELMNAGPGEADLGGWTLSDSTQVRHRFEDGFRLDPGAVVVVYGGSVVAGDLPASFPGMPASEGRGLGLNNNGDQIILRDQAGRLVFRIAYDRVAANSSMARLPGLFDAFVAHSEESELALSPGTAPPASAVPEEIPDLLPPEGLAIEHREGQVILTWRASDGETYSVYESTLASGPFTLVAERLEGSDGQGRYVIAHLETGARFFVIEARRR